MVRVTADSNIYISALNFGGLPDKVLDLARSGAIYLSICGAIVEEVSRVLRDKFAWDEDAIAQARGQTFSFAEQVEPQIRVDAVPEDPADNRILECALTYKSEFLITGDKHLLKVEAVWKYENPEPCRILGNNSAEPGRRG